MSEGVRITFAEPRWWQFVYRFRAWRDRRRTRNWVDVEDWLQR